MGDRVERGRREIIPQRDESHYLRKKRTWNCDRIVRWKWIKIRMLGSSGTSSHRLYERVSVPSHFYNMTHFILLLFIFGVCVSTLLLCKSWDRQVWGQWIVPLFIVIILFLFFFLSSLCFLLTISSTKLKYLGFVVVPSHTHKPVASSPRGGGPCPCPLSLSLSPTVLIPNLHGEKLHL